MIRFDSVALRVAPTGTFGGDDILIISDRNGALWRIEPMDGTMRPVVIEGAQKAKRRSKK